MLYLAAVILLWIQALCGEVVGESALLLRFWLVPIILLAFRQPQIRILPILVIGLMTDGLMSTPTGLHTLELCLIYGLLLASAKHLSDQSFSSRLLIGCLVAVSDMLVMTFIGWITPLQVKSNYLMENFFSLLACQIVIAILIVPLFGSMLRRGRRSDFRFRNERDNA